MTPEPDNRSGDGIEPLEHRLEPVRIQSITCGRCGWPNACRVQDGMRCLRFLCRWCNELTTGIVDPTLKGNVIF